MKISRFIPIAVISLLCLAGFDAFAAESGASATDGKITVFGVVIDSADSSPIPGAVVTAVGGTQYAMTEVDGTFKFTVPESITQLQVIMSGYKDVTLPVSENKLTIRMHLDVQQIEESQVIAYGTQSKLTVTGAISSIGTEDLLRSPNASIGNSLAGALTGISTVQTSGQPGAEDPAIYVRGAGSLTDEASKPLILVDGVERSFFQMDANEIESVTVLKDAASTAVFGVRGANGVILVTTRRGSEGKPQFSLTSSFGLTQPLRNLDMLTSYQYAQMYTEAQMNDVPSRSDASLMFGQYITEMFRTNQEPVLFPSVDWNKALMKDFAWQTQHNLTISGGSKKINYFIDLGFLYQDGLLKQMAMDYDPNYKYARYNYRANLDIHPNRTTTIRLNLGGRIGDRREPENYSMWQNLMWCTPFSNPGFVDGVRIYNGNNKYIPMSELLSGFDLFYNYGYNNTIANVMNIDVILDQRLDMITDGLSLNIKGAYNFDSSLTQTHRVTESNSTATPIYLGTLLTPDLAISDTMFDNTVIYKTDGVKTDGAPMSYGEGNGVSRNWYLEASLNYKRSFGNHDISGLLLYCQSKTYYPPQYSDIPTGYVNYVGRAQYSYKKRYLADFSIGINGSENFAPDKRFGVFPAGSVGWVISDESWMKGSRRWLDLLKIRASYGLVGNDKNSGSRFLYLDGVWLSNHSAWGGGGSYRFGTGDTESAYTDAQESTLGNPNVTWETCSKANLGIDLTLFDTRLEFTGDVFYDYRNNILSTQNTLASIAAVDLPMVNLGVVSNRGYEFSLGWHDRIKDFSYSAKFNMSFARNTIEYMDEVEPNYPWMRETGGSTGRYYGYLFDRYLQPSDFDADGNLMVDETGKQITPVMSISNPRPGDALFKDLNNDGKIDDNDRTWFGYGTRPEYVFGLILGLNYKGWGISMQWTGATNCDRLLSIEYREAFGTQNSRGLLRYLADGRCCEDNGYNGRFPRLTFDSKAHYATTSDLWMCDGSYLRLKTAEISYTFSGDVMKGSGIKGAKLFLSGYNLCTLFSELDNYDIDPEGMTGGSSASSFAYPNCRIYNIGVNLQF